MASNVGGANLALPHKPYPHPENPDAPPENQVFHLVFWMAEKPAQWGVWFYSCNIHVTSVKKPDGKNQPPEYCNFGTKIAIKAISRY
jgi:hypothetical protein